jgi:hypothetical protein
VGPRAGLEVTEKRKILPLPGIEHRPSNLSLYRLSYRDSPFSFLSFSFFLLTVFLIFPFFFLGYILMF